MNDEGRVALSDRRSYSHRKKRSMNIWMLAKRNLLINLGLLLGLAVIAQGQEMSVDWLLGESYPHSFLVRDWNDNAKLLPRPSPSGSPQAPDTPTVDLGEPELSFRYASTFGLMEEPYLVDSDHLNNPNGIGLEAARKLWVSKWPGSRAFDVPHALAESNAGWKEVGVGSATGGGISGNSDFSGWPSMGVAPNGTPYITWQDSTSGNREIYVRRWNGTNWEEVGVCSASGGGISDNNGDSYSPSIAIAPNSAPLIAWDDWSAGDAEIYVRRWNGSMWEEIGPGSASGGGISNNNDYSGRPSIAVASNGTPYIAWEDTSSGNRQIYLRRWSGSIWEEVGADSASSGGISNNSGESGYVSAAIAPDGTPYVAWDDDSSGNWEIYVRRWNGSSWEEVGTGSAAGGGISANGGVSWNPSMAVGPNGIPYVVWQDDSDGDTEIYVRRWNGSSWEEVGSSSAS
jgi:hypothetical protein